MKKDEMIVKDKKKSIGKAATQMLGKAKDKIVSAIDQNDDGTLDFKDATQLASRVSEATEETKEEVFDEASDNSKSKQIPNGIYYLSRKKKSDDNRQINAAAKLEDGRWVLLKGSIVGMIENAGVPSSAKIVRMRLPLDSNGVLLEDVELGAVSPSFAGSVVFNSAINGWEAWKDEKGNSIKQYQVD